MSTEQLYTNIGKQYCPICFTKATCCIGATPSWTGAAISYHQHRPAPDAGGAEKRVKAQELAGGLGRGTVLRRAANALLVAVSLCFKPGPEM